MIIELINEQTFLKTRFMSTDFYTKYYGYPNTHKYDSYVDRNNTFWIESTPGLFEASADIKIGVTDGANMDGSDFFGNSWGDQIFTLNYRPQTFLGEPSYRLQQLIRYKNQPLRVRVFIDAWCEKEMIITELSLLDGTITLQAANSGYGGYWDYGSVTKDVHPRYSSTNGYINSIPAMKLSGNMFGSNDYPHSTSFTLYLNAPQDLRVKSSGLACTLYKALDTDTYVSYDFSGENNEVYDSGERIHSINGTTVAPPDVWMTLNEGYNIFHVGGAELPEDFAFEFSYNNLALTPRRINGNN